MVVRLVSVATEAVVMAAEAPAMVVAAGWARGHREVRGAMEMAVALQVTVVAKSVVVRGGVAREAAVMALDGQATVVAVDLARERPGVQWVVEAAVVLRAWVVAQSVVLRVSVAAEGAVTAPAHLVKEVAAGLGQVSEEVSLAAEMAMEAVALQVSAAA